MYYAATGERCDGAQCPYRCVARCWQGQWLPRHCPSLGPSASSYSQRMIHQWNVLRSSGWFINIHLSSASKDKISLHSSARCPVPTLSACCTCACLQEGYMYACRLCNMLYRMCIQVCCQPSVLPQFAESLPWSECFMLVTSVCLTYLRDNLTKQTPTVHWKAND